MFLKGIMEFFGIYEKKVVDTVKADVANVEIKVNNADASVVQTVTTEIKKVEEQVKEAAKCGCGRSPTGFCVGLHKLSEAEWNKAKNAEDALLVLEKKLAKAVKNAETTVAADVKKVKIKTSGAKKNAK